MDSWGDYLDARALTDKVSALEARIQTLEERVDHLLDYIHESNFIQPTLTGGLVPRNRIRS